MSRFRSSLALVLPLLLAMHGTANASYQGNMFLNGQYQNDIKVHPETHFSVNPASNVFLHHAVISRQAAPFQAPTYLPPLEQLRCTNGQQCVRLDQCQNGYFSQQLPKIQNCNPESNICCTYRPVPTTTTTRRTTTTTTPVPFATCPRDSDCVSSQDCRNGEISAVNYVKKQGPNRCYAPEICCRMPSTTLTEDGYIFNLPEKTFPLPTNPTVPAVRTTQPAYRPQPTEYLPPSTTRRPVVEYLPPQTTRRPVAEYLPPQTTRRPTYQPQPTQSRATQPPRPQPTQPAYRPQPTQPAYRPQPTQPAPTRPAYRPLPTAAPTRRPTNEYLPPVSSNEIPHREPRPTQPQRYEPDRVPQPSNEKPVYRGEDQLSPQIFPTPQAAELPKHFAKCASALVCTTENYCNAIGVLSDTPIQLTPMEAAFRVPLTDCLVAESGVPGKCCRDPNYVDPWPVNLAGVCATRNTRTKPTGVKEIDANFAEIPWQAMILRESSKTLLCGGAIIGDEFVITTASCVNGVPVNDVRIKAGEWELGSTNEPLPFQLVGAKTIDIHPSYNPSTHANDLAIIRLDKRFEFATHIQPICISDEDPGASEHCVTTGWGKQALSIHEEGAIMHVTDASAQARSDCGADGTSVCSATKFDSCEFDVGSALACGSGSNVRLKGVYSAESNCGENQSVRFSKPDVKWINQAFAERSKPLLLKRF
ncbi:inactive serine protease scarface [Drosophila grimshawi]|uniref:GH21274 n=1 Tax=Drosophila grimshawi TaxID=7222 RepID=B4J7U5_DROGR|nr:inactive serine protease scarface [Drosophila grimshawi]XP_043072327.1 inactive serine protease scarface [Drosophila grimshawi]EDW01151.1 GH21274 [Drosophila grimshawi]